jgi:hypothetical protein
VKQAVLGVVGTRAAAEAIVTDLERSGFPVSDISVLFPDRSGTRDFAHEHHTKAPEGAATGGVTGGVIGGVLGVLTGIGTLAIPGLGLLVAAGPIMATLSGVAAGGVVGGVVGALVGLGIPEIEARAYEGKIRSGNILLAVHVDGAKERKVAKTILQRDGAVDVTVVGEGHVPKQERDPVAGR